MCSRFFSNLCTKHTDNKVSVQLRELLPNNFTLDFQLTDIYQTKSNLSFTFDISKTLAENDSEVAYPNVPATLPFGDVTVTKVAMSPLGNSIMLSVANPDPKPMLHKLKPIEYLSEELRSTPIIFEPRDETQLIVEKAVYNGSEAQVYYRVDGVYPDGYAVKLVLFNDQGKPDISCQKY